MCTSVSVLIAGSEKALNSWEVASKSLMMTASAAIESTARHGGLLDSWVEVGLPDESSASAGEEIVFVLVELELCVRSDEPVEAPLPLTRYPQ